MKEFSMILPCVSCNTVLESGHLYTRALLESLVKDFKSSDDCCRLVSLGHNDSYNYIDYPSVCAKVDNLFMYKNTLVAEITVLNTPRGRMVQTLVEEQEEYIKQNCGKNKYDFSLSPVGFCESINIDGIEVLCKNKYRLDFFTFKVKKL